MKLNWYILCVTFKTIAGGLLTDQIVNPPISPRIVGGKDAPAHSAPYQCSMQLGGKHFCGCAIISSNWILTAAHCIGAHPIFLVQIMVGTNDLRWGGTYYQCQLFIAHKSFDKPRYAYDIGLIRVNNIQFNNRVQPIKLSNKYVNGGVKLRVTGWGTTRADGKGPVAQRLQVLDVRSITQAQCRKQNGYIHKSHLCTLNGHGEGVCSGDSGSPLVLNGQLVGLTSFATIACARGHPDGFARISELYEWILVHINEKQ